MNNLCRTQIFYQKSPNIAALNIQSLSIREGQAAVNRPTNVPATCNSGNNGNPTVANSAYSVGDARCLDDDRDMHNYRDISEFCGN